MNTSISDEQKLAILEQFLKGPHHPSELTFVPGYTHYDARDREVIREMCHELARQGLLVPAEEHRHARTLHLLSLRNSGRAAIDQLRKSVGNPHPGIAEEPKLSGKSQGSGG